MDTSCIPDSLIWRSIIPFIPAFGLTNRILVEHRLRMYVINMMTALSGLSADEMRAIMTAARSFDFIDGGAFSYEAEGLSIYIDHHDVSPIVVMIMW